MAVIWFNSLSSVLNGSCVLPNNFGADSMRSRTVPLARRHAW